MNFLSLDVGSTCCKCQLFSESGEILAYKSEEYPLIGREGEEYVDIEGIFARVKEMMRFASAKGGFSSMCISTFGESFALLDKNDKAVFLPMLYTDPRGAAEAEEILQKFGAEELFSRVGVLPQSMFSLSKLLWIRRHAPEAFSAADKLLLICDYLGYMLTGERAIDYGLATRTGAFHVGKRAFDGEMLSAFGIDESTEKAAFTVLCIKTRSIRKEYDARVYSIPGDEKRLRPWTCKRIRMRDEITKPVLVCSHHVIAAIMKTDCCCIKTAAIFSTKKRETIPTSHHRSLILPRT